MCKSAQHASNVHTVTWTTSRREQLELNTGRERERLQTDEISPPFLHQVSHLLQSNVSWHKVKRKRRCLRKGLRCCRNNVFDKFSDVRHLVKVLGRMVQAIVDTLNIKYDDR